MINIKRALIIIPVTSCLLYANAENEDLKYLLKDSNTKFPVSDYIWQKQRPKQNVSDFYNSQSNTNNPAKPNSNLATKGNQVKLVGYDENGNPIYMDENGNLVDKNGNLILDSNGNPIKVKIGKDGKPILVDSNGNLVDSKGKPILDKNGKPIKVLIDPNGNPILMDSEGNLVDSSGKPILDKYGKPIKVAVDKNGNVVLVDSKGNLVDKDGDLILDTFGKPIRVEFDSDGNAILYDSNGVIIDSNKLKMLMKKHQVEKDLKKKKLQRKSKGTQGSKGKYTQKGKGKGNVKAKQPRHPILDEYGVDDLSELDNSEMSLDEIMRQSLLVANDSKTKEASTVKYGDSSFSNQENIDEATNEHKLHRMIPAGKLIPCVLLTPINSEIEGIVSAQVEQDIYAHMGKAVLIPRGSKVIGFYKNDNNVGQARLQIVWREIITRKA
nr:TrbI/VirB10 family protein [Helicobacter bilis]